MLQCLLSLLISSQLLLLLHLRVLAVSSTISTHEVVYLSSEVRCLSILALNSSQAFLVRNRQTGVWPNCWSSLNLSETDTPMTHCLSVQRVSSVGQLHLTESNINFIYFLLLIDGQLFTGIAQPSLKSSDLVAILSNTGLLLTGCSWSRSPTKSTRAQNGFLFFFGICLGLPVCAHLRWDFVRADRSW